MVGWEALVGGIWKRASTMTSFSSVISPAGPRLPTVAVVLPNFVITIWFYGADLSNCLAQYVAKNGEQ